MTPEQKVAYVSSQIACANIEIESMKVANVMRERAGYAPAYGENDFLAVIARYGLDHNSVVAFFQ